MKLFRLIFIIAISINIMGCYNNCDETVYVENSDGTTSIECVIYNN